MVSIQQLLRYFSLDQSGGLTNRPILLNSHEASVAKNEVPANSNDPALDFMGTTGNRELVFLGHYF